MSLTEHYADRDPGTVELLRWLEPNPNLPHRAALQARVIEAATFALLDKLGDGAELRAGLRKLLEAKDCFVRQALADEQA